MKFVNRKAMIIRSSGRSSDFITPSFGFGCMYKCSYCYMRRHVPRGISIAENTEQIIETIDKHVLSQHFPKIPNQTHDYYYTYDFSCNEDYVLHAKYHDWEMLFKYFRDSKRAMGTAATKYVNHNLLTFNPERKVRIRFSIMPQSLSTTLEPGTSKIIDRIKAVNDFYNSGYDVHINYSPIIMYDNHEKDYNELFELVDKYVDDKIKPNIKAECIFLTHNEKMHKYNIENNIKGENLLWTPEVQETKVSQYGNVNIRYKYKKKRMYINDFLINHKAILPWQKVRYIF